MNSPPLIFNSTKEEIVDRWHNPDMYHLMMLDEWDFDHKTLEGEIEVSIGK